MIDAFSRGAAEHLSMMMFRPSGAASFSLPWSHGWRHGLRIFRAPRLFFRCNSVDRLATNAPRIPNL